ncbi:S-adenosylmethionine decarboxylase proenzyme [Candidatus Endolissoclinum faulkneri L5]|uniref:S-adenosylmethionine decarboxylase proenzyme n=1 Tax=Candidatus Endolissoclinum faulkneri L5 TaxID=1401328 RepID=V9TVW4_9PROT|nr:adenosylmethionine decarboxylase [Candidatus Endolissoclinum faulkneri]AHC73843.1 S-adenosylmethionine decarboxylase proenzyme [Candidatus Endolissoclinum faulkneri L5]
MQTKRSLELDSKTKTEQCNDALDGNHRTDNIVLLPSTSFTSSDERFDHFVKRDGLTFAGTHLVIDLWGASQIDDIEHIETTLKQCVKEAGATLLNIHLHRFSPNGGVSGVVVLAESHISVHTWPECYYAAFDIFMCGEAQPYKSVDVLKTAFKPERINVGDHRRGIVA